MGLHPVFKWFEAPPKVAIDLSPTSAAAYESNGEQRTKEFHLKGDHRNYITLNLPENVTYHSGDTTKTGSVKISGGTKFYFSAPMTVTGTWNSGSLAGQMGTQWKTLVVSTGEPRRILAMAHSLKRKVILSAFR